MKHLAELEAHVMASECPAIVIAERSAMRELLSYVRVLEAEVTRHRTARERDRSRRVTVFVEQGSL